MTKKKGKSSRKSRRKGTKEDVRSTTSLPPAVEGPLRCFLRVVISRVTWTTPKLPDSTHVRLRWWGETTSGTIFRPVDGKNQGKAESQTVARFPIRCGPKQFAAYLSDMGSVSLDVLRGAAMTLSGRAQVNEISVLSPQQPVSGTYPVFSTRDSQKVGEVHVSMIFEPLIASYDSSSSLPTTDASALAPSSTAERGSVQSGMSHRLSSSHDSTQSARRQKKTFPTSSSAEEPTTSAASKVHSDAVSRDMVSDSSFADRSHPFSLGHRHTGPEKSWKERETHPRDAVRIPLSTLPSSSNTQPPSQPHHSQPDRLGPDLISALLDRGSRLRNAMIKEELGHHSRARTLASNPIPAGQTTAAEMLPKAHTRKRSTGDLFRELLHGGRDDIPVRDTDLSVAQGNQEDADADLESRAVELLVGDVMSANDLKRLKAVQSGLSPPTSPSSHSDVDFSEEEDPLHDNSILEELFYKGVGSSSEENLSDLLNSDTSDESSPQRKRKASTKASRRLRRSLDSSQGRQRDEDVDSNSYLDADGQDDAPHHPPGRSHQAEEEEEEEDDGEGGRDTHQSLSESRTSESTSMMSSEDSRHQKSPRASDPASGLSVQRLTLLGRVHVARVTIDKMTLKSAPVSRIPVRIDKRAGQKKQGRPEGKPPRPETQRKITYFVEYQFPVSQASSARSTGPGAMATELMRVVSKKVSSSGKEVLFGHRSVFPVQFDGQAVDRWWKQLLVFKVFSKTAGDMHPNLLGVSSIPLRLVLQSPDLVRLAELQVKDKQATRGASPPSTGHHGRVLGTISVSMELASDSKDFSSALAKTRVAEMQGAKIVPLPSTDPRVGGLGGLRGQTSSLHEEPSGSSAGRGGADSEPLDPGVDSSHSQPRGVPVAADRVRVSPSVENEAADGREAPGAKTKDEYEALTLHSLLYIREGHILTAPPSPHSRESFPRPHPYPVFAGHHSLGGRDRVVHNTYLVGRMFWSDDAARSEVCWGTTQPSYDYVQVSPVLLTQSLLERTRNNFTVIEVWDKKTSAQHDQLLGIAKLPLHQLYMSYRDQRIAGTLLKSQYPVVAVDNEVPITDPFSGQKCGHLTVLLALGSQQQVLALQRLKSIRRTTSDLPERPLHYAERAQAHTDDDTVEQNSVVEHVFEVVVEGIQGLPQLEGSVWGEADCFVQYHFPHQSQYELDQHHHTAVLHHDDGGLTLRPHRTATTLCIPDPTFNDVCRHRISLPQGCPVQRELLTACAGVSGHAGGIPFEVWCRFYYPNVRDQVIAKASLPLAKLCAMVTMQRRGEPSVQTFSLPLRSQQEEPTAGSEETRTKQLQDGGLLDVTVSYRQTVVRNATPSQPSGAGGKLASGGPHVSLAVTIHRACGLKTAAAALSRYDTSMQYPAQVGINSYIKLHLSFLAKDEVRVTRTIARSFCPEFNHFLELPCPLLLAPGEDECEGEMSSLAEALETADLILQVWHQVPGLREGMTEDRPHYVDHALPRGEAGRGVLAHRVVAATGDVLIGTVTIPLIKLLASRTGIEGWHPLTLPPVGWEAAPSDRWGDTHPDTHPDTDSDTAHHRQQARLLNRVAAGGVELSVKFGHASDREKVIHAGRKVGWSPEGLVLEDMEEVWTEGDEESDLVCEVTVDMDTAWFPVQSSLRPGQEQPDPHTKAYIRYKFYDRGAICSKLCYLDRTDDGHLSAEFGHSQVIHAKRSQPFAWYLREEQLEVQVWLSYNPELAQEPQMRPRHRDRLVGCAYIDLSPLCHRRVKRHRVSGVYPLFKPGCADMGGACLRAHVGLRVTQSKPTVTRHPPADEIEDESSEGGARPAGEESENEGQGTEKSEVEEKRKEEEEKERRNRPVWMTVVVERAMHLSDLSDPTRFDMLRPCCYVTFQSAAGPSPAATPTIPDSTSPCWQYTRDVAVSPQVLDNQSMIFKIWHQVSSKQDATGDRVLGFTSVDLGPLLAGIKCVDGWYNIMDFSGQTLGQIKISITPKESLSPLRQSPQHRKVLGSPNTSHLFSRVPLPPPHLLLSSPHPSSQTDSLPSRHPAARSLEHFQQHLAGVREYHRKLQDRIKSLHKMERDAGIETSNEAPPEPPADSAPTNQHHEEQGSSVLDRGPSTSYLMNNFRRNMQELESLHQHLKSKLSGGSSSSLPPTSERGVSHHHGSEVDDAQRGLSDGNANNEDTGESKTTLQHKNQTDSEATDHSHDLDRDEDQNFERYVDTGREGESHGRLAVERGPHSIGDGDYELHEEMTSHGHHYGNRMDEEEDDAWDEEEEEHEEDVIPVRPLNDISSAAFLAGISPDVISPPSSSEWVSSNAPSHDSASAPSSDLQDLLSYPDSTLHRQGRVRRGSEEEIRAVGHSSKSSAGPYDAFRTHHSDGSLGATHKDAVPEIGDDQKSYGSRGPPASQSKGEEDDTARRYLGHDETEIPKRPSAVGDDHSTEASHEGDVSPGISDVAGQVSSDASPDGSLGTVDMATRPKMKDSMDVRKDLQRENTASGTEASKPVSVSDVTVTMQPSDMRTSSGGIRDDGVDRREGRAMADEVPVDDGIVLTLDAREAELQRRQIELEEAERATAATAARRNIPTTSVSDRLPDFFLPPSDLEASMRALYSNISVPSGTDSRRELTAREREKFEAAQEMAQRLTQGGTRRQPASRSTPLSFKQPTAEEAKRIAKIFSAKF